MRYTKEGFSEACDAMLDELDPYSVDVVCNGKPGHECECQVEPDGKCPHGCRSILLVMGVM